MKSVSFKSLLLLSLPSILAVGLEPIAGLVDTIFVGRLDTTWLASLALTNSILLSCAWIFNFLNHGVTAWIAQAQGAKDATRTNTAITTTVLLAALLGLTFATIFFLGKEFLLGTVLGAEQELIEETAPYWNWRLVSYPFVLLNMGLIATLRGLRHLKTSLWIMFIQTLVNIVLTYVFLYEIPLGLAGAGIGTCASFVVGSALSAGVIFLKKGFRFRVGQLIANKHELVRFGGESANNFVRTACITASFLMLTSAATRLGESVVATHQVALQIWLISAFVLDGIAVTATTVGGHFLGANDQRSFSLVGKKLLLFSLALGFFMTIIFLVTERSIVALFSNDERIHELLHSIWWIVAGAQAFNALLYILDGVLFGARAFEYLRKRTVEAFILVFLPLFVFGYYVHGSLLGLWLPLLGINLYRFLSGAFWFWRTSLR